jgi:mono/diheme cytochrome c family protein
LVLGQGGVQQPGAASAASSGAAILEKSCSGCHAADVIASYHYESADGYRDVINSMVAAGATVTATDIPVLAEYLFKTYGKKPAQGTAPAAAADPGKALLESACVSCHGLDLLANHVYDSKEPYEGIVRSMIGYGAVVSDVQIGPIADYMLKTYGKKPAAATTDPGKAILESACTTCHGLEGLPNHKHDKKEPYDALVRSMMGYGAVVTDAQLPVLVDYMFKTFGKK